MIQVPETAKCVSFDVFDTLLTRKYIRPVDLFRDLENGNETLRAMSHSFAKARVDAEFDLRKAQGFSVEVTLDDIYIELGTRLGIDSDLLATIKNKELQLETGALTTIESMLSVVRKVRNDGRDVIFTSDTYLPESFLRDFLAVKGISQQGDDLYVSSTTLNMKANGRLFSYILKERGLRPAELFHVGDNEVSDYKVPRSMGIAVFLFNGSRPSRYEDRCDSSLLVSKISGVSRATRLAADVLDAHKQAIWNVTAGVSAPMVFFMVAWCVRNAVQNGLHRLYFLSRDGQIMYKVAKIIIEKFYKGRIEPRYLYVSRQALLFPAIRDIDEESLEWIMAPTSILTPHIILKRLNYSAESVLGWLKKEGFDKKLDKHLDLLERRKFRRLLKNHTAEILEKVSRYRVNTIRYLEQEQLLSDGLFGVVDIGWNGTLQRSLSRLLDSECAYDKSITGYYFGVKRRLLHKQNDSMYAWFSDYENPRRLDKKEYIVPMTELFTAADHGGVVKYEENEDAMRPVLKSEANDTGLKWGVKVQQESMLKYARGMTDMLTAEEIENIDEGIVDALEDAYRKFFTHPDRDEALSYGGYPLAEEQNESYYTPLAQPYTVADMLKSGFRLKPHHHNEWRQASIRLSGPVIRAIYQ